LTPSLREPISQIFVKVGDVVSKGMLLATLNDSRQLTTVAEARLQLLTAKKNVSSSTPQPNLQLARANLEAAQARYEYNLDQLNQTKLISPIDGVVSVVNGAVGEYPLPNDYQQTGGSKPMFSISSFRPPQFQALVNVADGANLYSGKPVSIVFDLPQSQVQRLANVQPSFSPTPNPSSTPTPLSIDAPLIPTTFTGVINSVTQIPPAFGVKPGIGIIVDFNQNIPDIYPGYPGVLKASVIAAHNAVIVPNDAIYRYGGLFRVNSISIFEGRKFSTPTFVKLGAVGDSMTQILEGVSKGDEVEVRIENKS